MIHNPMKIYEYLEVTHSVNLEAGDTVLDLGSGSGIWTIDLVRHCRKAIGIDVSKNAVDTSLKYIKNSPLKKRLEFYVGKIENLGFLEKSLDHIFSFCVLEHIHNLEEVLNEVKRILRPGGLLHVSVDSLSTINDMVLKTKHQREHFVTQYFTEELLRNKLKESGFRVLDIHSILKGDLAKSEFKKRIIGPNYYYSWFDRKDLVHRLRKEDQLLSTNEGIMLVAHALRP